MRLTDVMSGARLEVFAEIGLVIFAVAFVTVLVTTLLRRNQAAFERARHLPLDDEFVNEWRDGPARVRRIAVLAHTAKPKSALLHDLDGDGAPSGAMGRSGS